MVKNRLLTLLWPLIALASQAGAQSLWGVTSAGVADNKGVVFKSNSDGSGYSVQHTFVTDFPGSTPYYSLTLANGGKLYGSTYAGGANDQGVIFEFDPSTGTYTKKLDFSAATTGAYGYGGMVKASNNLLYGTAFGGGANSLGALFEYNPATNILVKKFDFNGTTGSSPVANMVQAANGKLYGMTSTGGSSGLGVIYEYDISGGYTAKYHFDGTTGGVPYGDLVEFTNGKLYGMTSIGGSNNKGVIFEYDPTTSTFTKKLDISPTGENPYGSLIVSGGLLWGTAFRGGVNNQGIIFSYDPVGNTLTKKIDMSAANGGSPLGSLYLASDSKMYGMTSTGGVNNDGAIFQYDPVGNTYTKKFDFAALTSGANPQSNNLVEAPNGKLYGLSPYGGPAGHGVLFEFDKSTAAYSKQVDFSNASAGSNPQGSLLRASNGTLYGVTSNGGDFGRGALFSIDPGTSAYQKIIDFDYTPYGAYPAGALTEAPNGKLYGLTPYGGANDNGVLFEYNPVGDYFFNRLDFSAAVSGSSPQGSLVVATNGKLYGTTSAGGSSGVGLVFEFDPNSLLITRTTSFTGTNGSVPMGKLLKAADGKLYGVASQGGAQGDGTLFSYDITTGGITKLKDFSAGNGANPVGELMQASNGKIYGLASGGGANGLGLLFEYDPVTNILTPKYSFDGATSGSSPFGGLTEMAVGKLFGLTSGGGAQSAGVYFRYDFVGGSFLKLLDLGGTNGSSPQYASVIPVPPKTAQTITFNALPGKLNTDPPFALTATASSGLTVGYRSSNPAIASVSGSTVTINSFGTVTITAYQYGDGTYGYAQEVSQSLVISRASQTITFNALPAKAYGDPDFTLSATASSGLTVSFASSDPTVASIVGTTVTIHKAGSVTITASQAGNATYDPAPDVPQTLTINKGAQTITFVQPALATLGVVPVTEPPMTLIASSTSGLTVTFTASPPGLVTITGNQLVIDNAGVVTITASQAGDANYNAAPPVDKILTITKGDQTITFGALPTKTYGDAPFDLAASATSGLPVSYVSTDPSVASIVGSTVTIHKAGAITITASQSGSSSWNPAPDVNQVLTINKASQTITFNALPTKLVSDPPFTISATASSGLPVSFVSGNISVATVSGNTITIVGAGTAVITAKQNGDADHYAAAPDVPQTLVVNTKLSQTITFNALPTKLVSDPPFTLNATATSGLTVTFASSNPAVATVSGSTVTIVGAGSSTITASQAGNATYNPAPDVNQLLVVQPGNQTITFGTVAPVTLGDAPFALTATASSGLTIVYTTSTPSKVSISGNMVTILQAGVATITATQPGNSNFNAATPVNQSFCVRPAKPTITQSNVMPGSATLTSSTGSSYIWFKNGSTVSGANGQVLDITSSGVYTVSTVEELCVSPQSDPAAMLITGDLAMGDTRLRAYPNPAKEKLYVDLSEFSNEPVTLESTDLTGRPAFGNRFTGGGVVEIEVNHLASGFYILTVSQGEKSGRIRWIKY